MTYAARRWTAGLLTLLTGAAGWLWLHRAYGDLGDAGYATGWTLLSLMLFLTLYNLRKKLPYPPLLSSAVWLQLHVYLGLLTVFGFLLHLSFRWPNGVFEVTLALLFIAVAGSGVAGIFLSRWIPRLLSTRGEEVLYERIPVFRRELHERAENLVVSCVEKTQTMSLPDHYRSVLHDFFRGPRHIGWHLCQSSRPLRRLNHGLDQLDRYFDDTEREIAGELRELIHAKDALDYHYTMQSVLKLWLFVHIPLTYVLLVFTVVHVVLVHTFVRVEP